MNDTTHVPQHVSFILDGNRRWAKREGLSNVEGHMRGMDKTFELVDWCLEKGISYLTVYAFSTENWNRSEEELDYLFNKVMLWGFDRYIKELGTRDVRVNIFGSLDGFPKVMQDKVRETVEKTAHNSGVKFNICLDYGGRSEITRAVKKILEEGIKAEDLQETDIAQRLYSAGIPDPDLMIRTGGEQRVSNFLIWQQAYTEMYFPSKFLPEFTKEDFEEALKWYSDRRRNFGK